MEVYCDEMWTGKSSSGIDTAIQIYYYAVAR